MRSEGDVGVLSQVTSHVRWPTGREFLAFASMGRVS
jgi:hypothetical protein